MATLERSTGAHASGASTVRGALGHPVVDCDGHTLDLMPVLLDVLREDDPGLADRLEAHPTYQVVVHQTVLATTDAQRRRDGTVFDAWWASTAHTLDRATAMLPGLLEGRMAELGFDHTILFPSEVAIVQSMADEELRRAGCRAHNRMLAELFGPHRSSITPVALIPMVTPEEAVAELRYAVGELGLKAVNLGGSPARRIPGLAERHPEAAALITRPELFGIDSDHDYDPVWAACQELGVAACFHAKAKRRSTSSYVYNHVGAFAAGNEAICKALFLGGVTRRFPELNIGFLEGGAAWATSLLSDLTSHWDKRGGPAIGGLDPGRVDVDEVLRLVRAHGEPRQVARIEQIEHHLRIATPPPERLDEFEACGIEQRDDIRDLFVPRFFFGCEADAPIDACAFDPRMNPFGAKLQAVLGSDIGHWDVPDLRGVLDEAYEFVEHGLMDADDFRAFTFDNAVRLHGGMNPAFFDGTPIEREARQVLERANPGGAAATTADGATQGARP
jgi:predicted TIM-barrel fold metal-dependent hydrolase